MEDENDWRLTGGLPHGLGKGDPFAAAIRATRMPMIVTDPRQDDNPIVFANQAFLNLTGYSRDEVMGRNCRFLQGPESDPDAIAAVREAIARRTDIQVDILNYKKDGSSFWNALYISPVIDEAGSTNFFFASQLDVTPRIELQNRIADEKAMIEAEVDRRTRELQDALAAKTMLLHEVDHRVKNNLQMIASLISLQARRIPDPRIRATLKSMLERVEALSTVHRKLYQSDDVSRFDVAEFVRDVANDIVGASGREDIALRLDLKTVHVPAQNAAAIALIVNEVVTNAIKHAFPDRPGALDIEVKGERGRLSILIADDGLGMNGAAAGRASLGKTLIENFGRQLDARVDWVDAGRGTRVEIELPIERAARG